MRMPLKLKFLSSAIIIMSTEAEFIWGIPLKNNKCTLFILKMPFSPYRGNSFGILWLGNKTD